MLDDVARSLVHDAPNWEEPADITSARQRTLSMVDGIRASARAEEAGTDGAMGAAAAEGNVIDATAPWPGHIAEPVAGWAATAGGIRDEMDAMVAKLDSDEKADTSRAWREWVSEGIDAGATRAHAASRLPQEVIPTVVETVGGTMSRAPGELLDAQRRKLRRLWRPAAAAYKFQWPDRHELPCLDVGRPARCCHELPVAHHANVRRVAPEATWRLP